MPRLGVTPLSSHPATRLQPRQFEGGDVPPGGDCRHEEDRAARSDFCIGWTNQRSTRELSTSEAEAT